MSLFCLSHQGSLELIKTFSAVTTQLKMAEVYEINKIKMYPKWLQNPTYTPKGPYQLLYQMLCSGCNEKKNISMLKLIKL